MHDDLALLELLLGEDPRDLVLLVVGEVREELDVLDEVPVDLVVLLDHLLDDLPEGDTVDPPQVAVLDRLAAGGSLRVIEQS